MFPTKILQETQGPRVVAKKRTTVASCWLLPSQAYLLILVSYILCVSDLGGCWCWNFPFACWKSVVVFKTLGCFQNSAFPKNPQLVTHIFFQKWVEAMKASSSRERQKRMRRPTTPSLRLHGSSFFAIFLETPSSVEVLRLFAVKQTYTLRPAEVPNKTLSKQS